MSGSIALDVAMASHASPEALASRRTTRLAELLSSAARNSPMYRELLGGRDPASLRLQDLPVMHKAHLMRHFDDWVADPHLKLDALRRFTDDRARLAEPHLGRYVVWESSGSTGEPGIFVQDAQAMAVYDALEALRRPVLRPLQRLLDPWSLAERIAFVGAIGGHFASTVSIERLRRLNPAMSGQLHSISFLQPVGELVAQLNALAPTVIATYPSAAVLLAQERAEGRLEASPHEVWTGGEDFSPAKRRFVQCAFGCAVANSYGASEFLALASECTRGRLHLNSDWAILESVDRHGHPVPAGQAGATALLTNLANHVQPLIRYDIGDRVTQHAAPCECGSSLPVIEVQGRSEETLDLGAAGSKTVSLLPLALSTVLEEEASLFDFQLVQRGATDLLLRTGLQGSTGELALRRARRALGSFLEAQGAHGVQIHCQFGEPIHCSRGGKIQRVVVALH
ncbi:phenylacetate--CoA ligase family protein [Variovorax sp. J22R133]|uniref:phenylacetate--CoA ligase family protein n=1 Tax=Variovorax brevis TaxID=3053503 RepID=UPI0025751B02|nr:phenylacetate--CoA ligase family protein [Variovorax sp. J22R133]MDM0116337.1 phenylacetate--CoA ligase family protein [Variovorax sp. J22R133]